MVISRMEGERGEKAKKVKIKGKRNKQLKRKQNNKHQ
jgi:hypothetical protein